MKTWVMSFLCIINTLIFTIDKVAINTWVLFFACLVICLRLFTFQRHGARYRPVMSFLAWLLMVCCFAVMVKLALNQFPCHVNSLMAAFSIWLAWVALSSKGNVAHFFRKQGHDY